MADFGDSYSVTAWYRTEAEAKAAESLLHYHQAPFTSEVEWSDLDPEDYP